MRPHAVVRAIGQYLTSTTLHGFKYLYSPYIGDRLAWLLSCIGSACCAGVLCGVLWGRFTSVPNLLSLRSVTENLNMPELGICWPSSAIASLLVAKEFGSNYSDLAESLGKALHGEDSSEYKLAHLDYLLKTNKLTLGDALMKHGPSCGEVVLRCRVAGKMVSCGHVVKKRLTPYSVCCVADIMMNNNRSTRSPKELEMVIQTPSDENTFYEFYGRYTSKGWTQLTTLTPGHFYIGKVRFISVMGESDRIAGDGTCDNDPAYSRVRCLRECSEAVCGCGDPIINASDHLGVLCPLTRLPCLRKQFIGDTCTKSCIDPCEQVTTFMSLEYVVMDALEYEIDPLYDGIVGSKSIVISIIVKNTGSQVFVRMPTETWLTLLSSLGGVFNMFLGVGLFSGLELLYFVCVRLPIAIKKSLEMDLPSEGHVSRASRIE